MEQLQELTIEEVEDKVRKEQDSFKVFFEENKNFLEKLRLLVDASFETPKFKRENHLCREKVLTELLKLFQSEKKFEDSEKQFSKVMTLGVYDKKYCKFGRITDISIEKKAIRYLGIDKSKYIVNFSDSLLFDVYSLSLMSAFTLYKQNNVNAEEYHIIFDFLTNKDFNAKAEKTGLLRFGRMITDKYTSKITNWIFEEQDATLKTKTKKKAKKYLLCLDSKSLSEIGRYNSIDEAANELKISKIAIALVLCQGKSTVNNLEAAGFKWEYSTKQNSKYSLLRNGRQDSIEGN